MTVILNNNWEDENTWKVHDNLYLSINPNDKDFDTYFTSQEICKYTYTERVKTIVIINRENNIRP